MDNTAYMNILKDTLVKKLDCLEKLREETNMQERCLLAEEVDVDGFDEAMARKETLIIQINQLDDGFQLLYQRVAGAIKESSDLYQIDIQQLQELISKLIQKSTEIQVKERTNKEKLETYLSYKKNEVKTFKKSNQTVSSYYKSMSEQYRGESYFLDKKK